MLPIQSSSSNSIKPNSVWVECGTDPGFQANCFERDKSPSLLPRSSKRVDIEEKGHKDEDTKRSSLVRPVELPPCAQSKHKTRSMVVLSPWFVASGMFDPFPIP